MTFRRIMRSFRLKLLMVMLSTTAVALLLAGSALLYIDMRDYHGVAVRDIQTQIALIGRASAPALQFGDPQVAAENLTLLDIRPSFEAAAIYNSRGQIFATYVRHGLEGDFPRFPGNEGVWMEGGNMFAFHRILFEDQIAGTIYARIAYPINERLLQGAGVIGLIILAALVLATLMSGWLQRFLIKPVVGISTTARRIVSNRDYSLRAEKLSDDEVGDLADSFNAMLAEIEARAGELERFNRDLQNEVAERRRVEAEVWRLNRELDSRVRKRTRELEQANAELEAFAYSVSHDLRAPLRSIDGYGEALAEELGEELPDDAGRYLDKIRTSTRRMGQLIEELLNLSRLSRAQMRYDTVDLSAMAGEIINEQQQRDPERKVHVVIWGGMTAKGDPHLIRVVMVNLLSNAWKFTAHTEKPTIEVGNLEEEGRSVYFVRDNGVGFDMAYSDKLFGVFQRLHGQNEFPGIGIGLATVQRVIRRHGGRVWANAAPGRGAVFYFTLRPDSASNAGDDGTDGGMEHEHGDSMPGSGDEPQAGRKLPPV
ncbi:MAG: ATP-binding protein [Gammaproteobacteria bacterium]|jgi:signal transduction histidine kinase|nr:ATP-binding protein [Gammaproteobacteria bacterium]